mgnify:CR=1 FL=1
MSRDNPIAASSLVTQRLGLHPIDGVPNPPADIRAGYALQGEVNRRLEMAGMGRRVGHKIGCTTPVMQAFLGIPSPCAGEIFAGSMVTWDELPTTRWIWNSARPLISAAITSASVENLVPATWYFAVKAYTSAGVESDLSNEASKTIM